MKKRLVVFRRRTPLLQTMVMDIFHRTVASTWWNKSTVRLVTKTYPTRNSFIWRRRGKTEDNIHKSLLFYSFFSDRFIIILLYHYMKLPLLQWIQSIYSVYSLNKSIIVIGMKRRINFFFLFFFTFQVSLVRSLV